MDITIFNRAKQAYDAKDWEGAVILFSQCGVGPGTGEACHLCGNAMMRIGRVQEATQAYRAALSDPSYGNRGAVLTNLGKAQMALGDLRGAIDSLREAPNDQSYRAAYKAYMALGEVYSKLGDSPNAGGAYRQAALDDNNPDPAKALINLGVSYMQLRRYLDAVEAYRWAIDLAKTEQERCLVQANLGQAYVASGRMNEAVGAFEAATANGFALSPAAKVDYDRALQMVQARNGRAAGGYASEFGGPSAGFDQSMGTGDFLPPADSSGFFDISEAEIAGAYKSGTAYDEKPRHRGLKVFLTILVIVLVLAGAGVGAYFAGLGIPTRESAVTDLFEAAAAGDSASGVWSSKVGSSARAQAMSSIEGGAAVELIGMDSAVQDSVAIVQTKLPQGAALTYRVSLVREGIGWKVSNVERVISSETPETYSSALAASTTQATTATAATNV